MSRLILGEIIAKLRDLRAIGSKLLQVLYPNSGNAVLRDWDLWGPLLFTITLAILLSLDASPAQSLSVFTGVFVIVSVGSVVVTLNCKLLGGKVCVRRACVLSFQLTSCPQLVPAEPMRVRVLPLPSGSSSADRDLCAYSVDTTAYLPYLLRVECVRLVQSTTA